MREFDFTPLLRSSVGFDHLYHLLDSVTHADQGETSYPPYDIEKLGEDSYRITLALAGFTLDDLDLVQQENLLIITGRREKAEQADQRKYLHKGIAQRAFERRFELADHIKVTGADLVNGLLTVELVREVPEAKRPRSIPIGGSKAKALPEPVEA